MGVWRSITDWMRALIGWSVLLIVVTVCAALTIAALLVFVDPNLLEIVGIKKLEGMKTEEEKKAEKRETLLEFLKKIKPSEQFSKRNLGRPIGKLVAMSNGNLDPINSELPAELVAQTPKEVDAIALIASSERVVGIYNNRVLFISPIPPKDGPNAAKCAVIAITVIEADTGEKIHVSGDIFGPPPPKFLQPGASPPAPESPRPLAVKYLTSLPRKATGKVLLDIEGTLEPTDPPDPVLAKIVKLGKIRTHMKEHTVSLQAGKACVITMTSDAFDTHLRIEDAAGKQLAAHRDALGMHRARIVFTPPETGNYRILAASYDGKAGPYMLSVQEAE